MKLGKSIVRQLGRYEDWYGTAALFLLLALLFSALSGSFFTFLNFRNMILQNSHMLIIVAGLAVIMTGGGIDFSIGYQISLVSAVIGFVLGGGGHIALALLAGMFTGILCGVVNGALVAYFQFAPFIATLITQMVFQGISYLISEGRTYTNIPGVLRGLTEWTFFDVPLDLIVAVLSFLLIAFLFRYTFFGRQVRAVGENAELAERAGIRVRMLQFSCYMFAGFLYSLAAMILISRQSAVSSSNGVGSEIIAISAVLIGRCNIRFSEMRVSNVHVWNILLGLLVCIVIENGMLLLGATQYVQYLCIGLLVIVALLDGKKHGPKKGNLTM